MSAEQRVDTMTLSGSLIVERLNVASVRVPYRVLKISAQLQSEEFTYHRTYTGS